MTNDAVKVVVYDSNGRILVLRRSGTHPTLAFHPDLPGGDVDPGETPFDAVLREVKEETGIDLCPSIVQHEYTKQTPLGGSCLIYSARLEDTCPEVVISWEHDAYDWMHVPEFVGLPEPPLRDDFLSLTKTFLAA